MSTRTGCVLSPRGATAAAGMAVGNQQLDDKAPTERRQYHGSRPQQGPATHHPYSRSVLRESNPNKPKRSDEHHVQGFTPPQNPPVFLPDLSHTRCAGDGRKGGGIMRRRPWATTAEQHGDLRSRSCRVDCPRIADRGSKGDDSRT